MSSLLTIRSFSRSGKCWDGEAVCDHSRLSAKESSAVGVAHHERNYVACASGSFECVPSRLTPTEASAIIAVKGYDLAITVVIFRCVGITDPKCICCRSIAVYARETSSGQRPRRPGLNESFCLVSSCARDVALSAISGGIYPYSSDGPLFPIHGGDRVHWN